MIGSISALRKPSFQSRNPFGFKKGKFAQNFAQNNEMDLYAHRMYGIGI
jgi:hypothetical protein